MIIVVMHKDAVTSILKAHEKLFGSRPANGSSGALRAEIDAFMAIYRSKNSSAVQKHNALQEIRPRVYEYTTRAADHGWALKRISDKVSVFTLPSSNKERDRQLSYAHKIIRELNDKDLYYVCSMSLKAAGAGQPVEAFKTLLSFSVSWMSSVLGFFSKNESGTQSKGDSPEHEKVVIDVIESEVILGRTERAEGLFEDFARQNPKSPLGIVQRAGKLEETDGLAAAFNYLSGIDESCFEMSDVLRAYRDELKNKLLGHGPEEEPSP